jgi:hypothetical protein
LLQEFQGSLCSAGGSVVNLLRPAEQQVDPAKQDLDFFFVAPSAPAAVNTLTAVLRSLERHAKHVHSVILTTNAVTVAMVPAFTNTLIKLQFVILACPSVAAVVHSFDITWCMAAFTGTCVYFAQLRCAAMQRGYGIVTSPVRQL